MAVIYGPEGVKAGFDKEFCRQTLDRVVEHLRDLGGEAFILGCTELPLVLPATTGRTFCRSSIQPIFWPANASNCFVAVPPECTFPAIKDGCGNGIVVERVCKTLMIIIPGRSLLCLPFFNFAPPPVRPRL